MPRLSRDRDQFELPEFGPGKRLVTIQGKVRYVLVTCPLPAVPA